MKVETVKKRIVTEVDVERHTFKADLRNNCMYYHYTVIIEDGKLIEASAFSRLGGPPCSHEEYIPRNNEGTRDELKRILKAFAYYDMDNLKIIYNLLNDEPVKEVIRSIQKEWIKKLSF